MADLIDQAQSEQEQHLARAMARHRSPAEFESLHFGLACGARIPEERRQAVPGCTTCIDCQSQLEKRHHG
ncbi:MAG: TraR/DksA C4-type zinc finger protein [Rhodospirillales bacterium]|nr:TraR/DksA C4-type zinc finger protein [Rhodospirillales bacterium]